MSPRAPLAVALAVALVALLAPTGAQAACTFAGNEISNPFAPGCGDLILTYVDTTTGPNQIALGYPPPIPVASLTPVAGFRDYASLFARHQDLTISTSFVQGTQVGSTVNAQAIWAYELGDADATVAGSTRPEPAIMINGGIHAREWQSPEVVTEFMERIALNGNDGGYHQYIAENLNVVVLPVQNVDGLLQTQLYPTTVTATPAQPREGRMRRKNKRNPNTLGAIDSDINTVADNFWGVDLNRNNSIGFGLNGRSSSSVTSLVFRGPNAASEPEVAALQAAAALGPAAQLRMYSDTHSFTQAYLVSTTADARLTSVTQALLTKLRAVGTSRTYGVVLDAANGDIGTTADYFNDTYDIPAWTLEIEPINGSQDYGGQPHGHGGFITPDAHITRVRDDIANMYLRGAYVMAGPPGVREIMLTQVGGGGPGPAYHARWTETSATARTLTVLSSTTLVPGASYSLWVAFDKPMRLAATPTPRLTVAVLDPSGGVVATPVSNAGDWEFTVTGNSTGALRYAGDAITASFTMPSAAANLDSVRLQLSTTDLAGSSLDGAPSSIAGWSAGHWTEYENGSGVDGDLGGTDQSYSLDAPGTGLGGGGGGGGGAAFELLLLLLGARLLRSRR